MSNCRNQRIRIIFIVTIALVMIFTGSIQMTGYPAGINYEGVETRTEPEMDPGFMQDLAVFNRHATVGEEPETDHESANDQFYAGPATEAGTAADSDINGHDPAADQEQESVQNTSDNPAQSPVKPPPSEPVSYVWGSSHQVSFRSEIHITNNGSESAVNVWVDLPMLENNSPYQVTNLTSTNYDLAYTTGRIGSFGIGDLEPGETKIIITDYTIAIRPVSIKSTNETVEKARQAYQQHAGSGNCLTLATRFVNRCRELGVTARLVYGFARPQRSNITPGSLAGNRHSWAEFYVDGLGWVPVDLTFQYFGNFPYASHVIETYADKTVKVYHLGGSVSVSWHNSIF